MSITKISFPTEVNQSFAEKKRLIGISADLSRKGDIDEPIKEIISFINNLQGYVTTSSCSGRIIILSKEGGDSCKKGCKWILTSHTTVDLSEVLEKVKCCEKNMVLKFEPFILHVQCQDVTAAKKMQNCALEAGFRNSGSVFGRNGNITFAVRGTHGLEVPLSDEERLLVNDDYMRYIVDKANSKMCENMKKIEHFSRSINDLKSNDQH